MPRVVTYTCLYLITLGVKAQLGHQADPGGNLVNDKQFILPISSDIQDVHVINAAKNGIVLLINEFGKFGTIESEGSTYESGHYFRGTLGSTIFCTIGLYITRMGSF